jgi:hypothetical protein
MTPRGVYDLTDKDSGDAPGDTSFVLYQKNMQYFCRNNPTDFHCTDVAQFAGDSPNNTDVVLEFKVEVDG